MDQVFIDSIAELIALHTESYEVVTFDWWGQRTGQPQSPIKTIVHRIDREPFVAALSDLFADLVFPDHDSFVSNGAGKSIMGVRFERDRFAAKAEGKE